MSEPTITTLCKDCVFATWTGDVQSGCELGRLERFNARNEACTHDGKVATINRLCNTCRNKDWFNKQMIAGFTEEENSRQLKLLVEKETAVKYAVVLVENSKDDGPISSLKIWESCKHIIQQEHKPERVIIAVNNPNINRIYLLKQVKYQFMGTGIKYFISYIIDQTSDLYSIIDIVFSSLDDQYYTVLNNGYILPRDFGSNLNKLINDDLVKAVMIKPWDDKENGLTISCILHKMLNGNRIKRLTEKIEEIAETVPNKEAIIECFQTNSQ